MAKRSGPYRVGFENCTVYGPRPRRNGFRNSQGIFSVFLQAGMNFDEHTPAEQIIRLLGSKGVRGPPSDADLGLYKTHDAAYGRSRPEPIPKEFDARKEWKRCRSIGEVRDQGNCGSCWVRRDYFRPRVPN